MCYSSLMVAITLHGTHRACIPHLDTHLASHITWHSLSGIWWLLRQHRQHSSAPSGCMAAVMTFKLRPVDRLCLISDHHYQLLGFSSPSGFSPLHLQSISCYYSVSSTSGAALQTPSLLSLQFAASSTSLGIQHRVHYHAIVP